MQPRYRQRLHVSVKTVGVDCWSPIVDLQNRFRVDTYVQHLTTEVLTADPPSSHIDAVVHSCAAFPGHRDLWSAYGSQSMSSSVEWTLASLTLLTRRNGRPRGKDVAGSSGGARQKLMGKAPVVGSCLLVVLGGSGKPHDEC